MIVSLRLSGITEQLVGPTYVKILLFDDLLVVCGRLKHIYVMYYTAQTMSKIILLPVSSENMYKITNLTTANNIIFLKPFLVWK